MRRTIQAELRRTAWTLAVLLSAAGPGLAQKPKVEVYTVDEGLVSPELHDVKQDPRGRLWIAGRSGVTAYDGRTFVTYTAADGLPSSPLGAVAVDGEGGLWTVSLWSEPRVYRFDGARWRKLRPLPSEEVPGSNVSSLAVVSLAGHTLVAAGSVNRGLWLWDYYADGSSSPGRRVVEGLPSDQVHALAPFAGAIAAATSEGLCLLAEGEPDCGLRRGEPRLAEPIRALAPTADGKRLWILAADWLGYLEDGKLRVVEGQALPPLRSWFKASLAVDAAGGTYFGNREVIYYLDPAEGLTEDRLETVGVREGLAAAGATAFLTDRESNVWVASLRGLSRIESRRFLSFDASQGLLDDEVTAFVEQTPGRFVLGHNAGLTFLDGGRPTPLSFAPSEGVLASDFRALDMAVDDGIVWIAASDHGLLRLDRDRRLTRHLTGERVVTVEIDREGRLWAFLEPGGLLVRDGDSFVRAAGQSESPSGARWLVAMDDGRLFASSKTGLNVLADGAWRRFHAPTPEADNVYCALAVPSSEDVWVGTGAGLYELRDEKLALVDRGQLSLRDAVYFIVRDGEGRTWFGTDDGVRVWDGTELRHLSVRHGLAGRETNRGAGYVDGKGRVWIGTDRGLSLYQPHHDRRRTVAPVVELMGLEVAGRERSLAGELALASDQNHLLFHFRSIAFSRQDEILVRYRLDGFDESWQVSEPESARIRYTNLKPGTYRFRIAASWAGADWGPEAVSPAIAIARPYWARAWFYAAAAAVVAGLVLGAHTLKTRAIRAKNLELLTINLRQQATIEQRKRAEAERDRVIEDLEAKNLELESFTYTVSHDLKSPLVTIKGFLGYLKKDAAAGNMEALDRDVQAIEDASEKMGQLLEDLLELSRIGRVVNPAERVDLGELAREVEELLAGAIAERGVRLEIAPGLPVVTADRVRLREVLQNLIENAVKFLGAASEPRVEVGSWKGEGEVVCYVRDNGVGIEPRYHQKVFGLFERLSLDADGTGIGLALARRIVEVHGGRIWVESEGLGKGATFFFALPDEAVPVS